MLPLFDRLYDAPIRFIIPRHEQGGCHMADAYARASGKIGVVLATSGPGACNLVTGLATAMMDSIPLVAITGQVRTELIGNDAFQEADTTGITRPVTKYNSICKDIKDLERTVREAFYIASTGRPGPVLIDLPVDISVGKCKCNGKAEIDLPGYRIRTKGHARQISMAAEAINKSEQPVLYVGGGVISGNASEELRAFADKAHLPVTMTLLGLGSYDQRRPESLDMLGMHGSAYANYAVQECDLLIAVGARFDDRVTGKVATFAPHAKIIHIDIDPSSISKNVQRRYPGRRRRQGHPARADQRGRAPRARAVVRQDRRVEEEVPVPLRPPRDDHQAAVRHRRDLPPDEGRRRHHHRRRPEPDVDGPVLQIHQAAAVHQLRRPGHDGLRPARRHRRQIARPDATVIDIDGDHSFNMTMTELATAVAVQAAHQGLHPEQRLHGHGPPVAGALLRQTLCLQLPEEPRLRRRRPRPRRRRDHRGQERRGPEGHRADARREEALRGRLPRRAGRKRLADGPCRQEPQRNGRPGNPRKHGVTIMMIDRMCTAHLSHRPSSRVTGADRL